MNINTLWWQKYRPQNLQDLILNDSSKNILSAFSDKKDIPHLLFCGSAGIGKCLAGEEIMEIIVSDEFYEALVKNNLLE